jgi:C4-dicarboxylate-specific signal transduction histidine kinase
MSQTPEYIDFGRYTEDVPAGIPAAVQQATGRFQGNRALRVAEVPEWETLRQQASDLRLHTLLHLDHYLEQLEQRVTAAGGQVHVEVADRGEGIPADELPRLFDKFYRRKGTRHRGAGLGLAIVRRIVEDHRGTVSLTSEPGRGSRAIVSLPVSAGAAA